MDVAAAVAAGLGDVQVTVDLLHQLVVAILLIVSDPGAKPVLYVEHPDETDTWL